MKLTDIVGITGGTLVGDGSCEIHGVATLEDAREGEIAFLANTKYTKYLKSTHASAVIVPAGTEPEKGLRMICTENPYYAFLKVVVLFHPQERLVAEGVHPTAVIGENTKLGKGAGIGPYVVIGKDCRIGDGTVILPFTTIGDGAALGEGCTVYSHVSIREKVTVGNRVILHCGVVVGSDGFGFAQKDGKYHKIPQVGTVVIEDDVEIGANTTIDRATLGETRIKAGVKLDNLIQIGHNCVIGEDTVIAAQSGLSGSTLIGKGVRVGGQVGFAGHMTIGDGAALGAKSGVSKSVPPRQFYSGIPAIPHLSELRKEAASIKLSEKLKELSDLQKRIEALEKKLREKC